MQANGAARAAGGDSLKRVDLVTADRRADHHHRCGIETAAPDQVANGAVDAGTDTVIVGAQPDAARRRGVVHSAAVRSPALLSAFASRRFSSRRFSLCSATK